MSSRSSVIAAMLAAALGVSGFALAAGHSRTPPKPNAVAPTQHAVVHKSALVKTQKPADASAASKSRPTSDQKRSKPGATTPAPAASSKQVSHKAKANEPGRNQKASSSKPKQHAGHAKHAAHSKGHAKGHSKTHAKAHRPSAKTKATPTKAPKPTQKSHRANTSGPASGQQLLCGGVTS